ncbi:MAG: GHMP kinase [Pseudomonadota bacterium]
MAESRAHAPGKLILSGEHSVLYGAPALAMAVRQYTEVWFKPLNPGEGLRTVFADLSSGENYPLKLLSQFKSSLDRRFDQFLRGEVDVLNIMKRPDDLAVYTLATLVQDEPGGKGSSIPGIGAVNRLLAPGQLGSRSSLPIGAGLGSSAAVVAATTVLFEHILDRPKTLEERYERVRFCERLKHGKAGPIDAAAVVRGGLVRADNVGIEAPELPEDHGLLRGEGWYWVLHGRPESSTGECVSHVRVNHGSDSALWDSFGNCTKSLIRAMANGENAKAEIRENQRLLEMIGVVPDDAKEFVRQVEALDGAAKICGAGSIRGDAGGVILVHLEDGEAMIDFMAGHSKMSWSKLQLAKNGASIGPAPVPFAAGALG